MSEAQSGTAVSPPGSRRAKQPLSRERIMEAALRIVDTEGLDALTMRRLAVDLDVAHPALYWHVRSRDELLAGLFELAMARVTVSIKSDGTWQDQVSALCRGIYQEFRAHPRVFMLAATYPAPSISGVLETFLELMKTAGLEGSAAAKAARVLAQYPTGMALAAASRSEEELSRPGELLAGQPLRLMATIDDDAVFEHGLELMLAALTVQAPGPGAPLRGRRKGRAPTA